MRLSIAWQRPVRSFGLIVLVLTLAGCGIGGGNSSVSGTVTHNGKALGHARIGFSPVTPGAGGFGNATANANGQFTVAQGLPAGEYKVVVVMDPSAVPGAEPFNLRDTPEQARQRHEAAEKIRRSIPKQYSDPAATPLRVTVPGTIKLDLTGSPGS